MSDRVLPWLSKFTYPLSLKKVHNFAAKADLMDIVTWRLIIRADEHTFAHEMAAFQTLDVIEWMQSEPKPRRRATRPKVVGQAGPRDSMFFDDEFADPNPVIFDKSNPKWRMGRWIER